MNIAKRQEKCLTLSKQKIGYSSVWRAHTFRFSMKNIRVLSTIYRSGFALCVGVNLERGGGRMNIGERIKRYRIEKRMAQKEVADRAGVTEVSVSRWENGMQDPTFRDVEKIAAALGVTMEELTREPKRGKGLRKIIDGKLYDTESALILFKFRRKYQDTLNPLFFGKEMVHVEWEDAQYLKTERGAYLFYCPKRKDLQVVAEKEVKDVIRQLDADTYIRIFGQVEEG